MKKLCFALFLLLGTVVWGNAAETQTATIYPNKIVNTIDEKVYSHFLEHIYNSCNGGLWGELVWNRSFEAGKSSGWSWKDGVFIQKSRGTDVRLLFENKESSEKEWTDYEMTLNAKKISGEEGFLLIFRADKEYSNYYWVNLGGWANTSNGIERGNLHRRGAIIQKNCSPFETGRVYALKLRVEKSNIKVWVDEELVFDFDDPDGPKSGFAGLGTWSTAAEFSDVKVEDLKGNLLYDGNAPTSKIGNSLNIRFWQVEGSAQSIRGDARNSNLFLQFLESGKLSQSNFAFNEGEKYDYSFWVRGQGTVCFDNADSKTFDIDSDKWTKISGDFSVNKSTADGTILFELNPESEKTLDIDQVSIMPRSWKEKYCGFRPDLLNAIKEIKPTMIRWPGGCYASAYRWKSGIGSQDDRVSYPTELWNDVDVNSFGIDEFVQMCRLVGAEPDVVVNIGTVQWKRIVGDPELDKVDWNQEVCDLVEYCNGSADTKWGAVRAKNGHPEPYGIKFWEIDNEVLPRTDPASQYTATINELVPRMKAIDPSIIVIACGSWTGDKTRWDADVLKGAAKNISFLSTHRYDDPNGFATNPWQNQRFFEERREMIAKSDNPNVRMFDSEWNAQSTDWRTGLHAGGILNCFERVGDVLEIAAPALFLRHVSADGWDNAFINFDQSRWFPAPNYVVMKLWRDHFAPYHVEMTSDDPWLSGREPALNAIATKSEDGKTVYVKAVNTKPEDVVLQLNLEDCKILKTSAQMVTPSADAANKLRQRNTLDAPDRISPQEWKTVVEGNSVQIELPSYSAGIIVISVE